MNLNNTTGVLRLDFDLSYFNYTGWWLLWCITESRSAQENLEAIVISCSFSPASWKSPPTSLLSWL